MPQQLVSLLIKDSRLHIYSLRYDGYGITSPTFMLCYLLNQTLRKHAYSNILKILPLKNENFQIKNSDIFNISAQNVDCG